MKLTRSGCIGTLTFLSVLAGSPTHGWLVEIPGAGDNNGKGRSVAFDSAGNIVAGGAFPNAVGAVKVSRSGAVLWKTNAFDGWGGASAVMPNDDVAVVGAADNGLSSSDVGVATLSAANGAVLFESTPLKSGNHWAQSVATNAAGNVFAGCSGGPGSGSANGLFAVSKYAGIGSWTRSISISSVPDVPGHGVAMKLAVAADSSIVAVGRASGVEENQFGQFIQTPYQLLAVKLANSDGSVLWQTLLDEASIGADVAIDASGDIVIAGQITPNGDYNDDFLVLKLDGNDGSEVWRAVFDGGGSTDSANSIALSSSGDVVAGGVLDLGPPTFGGPFGGVGTFTVVKLDGDDGSTVWQTNVPNDVANAQGSLLPPGVRGEAQDLAFDPLGNVIAVGALNATWLSSGTPQARDFVVIKLTGGDGTVDWLQNIGDGEAFAVDVDAAGLIAVAGWTLHEKPGRSTNHFAVLGVSDCVAGRSLKISEGSGPRSLKLKTSDKVVHASAEGTSGDPTLHGARLILTESGSMNTVEVDLPAHNWSVRRGKYKYRDQDQNDGPCTSVKVSRGKIIARCQGSELDPVTAQAPLQSLALRLELGSASLPFCMQFGGDLRRNTASTFQARNAPAPTICLGR